MVNHKTISVIIPVYNTEQYLEKCLLSVLQQTYTDLEIICIDDGSTDKSGKIIDDFSERDHRIIAIHQQNAGESAARNIGIKNAKGNYIAFMDCDDWIEPNMYENLVSALESTDADMAISGWYKDYGDYKETADNLKPVEQPVFERNQLMRYVYERDSYRAFAYIWDKLYRRELLVDGDGKQILFDETLPLGGDVLFLARLVLNTQKAVYIDKAFYHYIQRPDSGSHLQDFEKRKYGLKAYEMVIEFFEKANVGEDILAYVKRFLVYHSMILARMAYRQNNKDNLLLCKQIMNRYECEYREMNASFSDRIKEFEEILEFKIED